MQSPSRSGLITALILALALSVLVAGAASAGGFSPLSGMDGAWFKIKFKAKGIQILQADTAMRGKGSTSATCYMLLDYNPPEGEDEATYSGDIICETEPGSWQVTESGYSGNILADGASSADDKLLDWTNADGHFVTGYGSHIIEPRFNEPKDEEEGSLKKASFVTLGAEVISDSTLDGGDSLFLGGYSAKGSTVDPEKLPEGVIDALLQK